MNVEITEPENYRQRKRKTFSYNIIIIVILTLIIWGMSNWQFAILFGVILFIVQSIKSNNSDKTYVLKINSNNSDLIIEYREEDVLKQLIGKKEDFVFEKKALVKKVPTHYLAIYYKNNLAIKQFPIGNWTLQEIDKVIASYKIETS